MHKAFSLLISIAFCMTATLALAADKGEAPAGKAPVTVTIKEAAKKQPPVVFPHEKHTKAVKTCDTCHHTNKGLTAESKVKVEKCSDCHMKVQKNISTMADMSLTKNPMHIKCVGCHKASTTAKPKPPVACTGCHKKTT